MTLVKYRAIADRHIDPNIVSTRTSKRAALMLVLSKDANHSGSHLQVHWT